MTPVSYEILTARNAGFLSAPAQERLRDSSVFVCGVGGMGGAAVASLARAGVGHLGIADFDVFEETNLNRQVFSTVRTLGRSKTEATAEALLDINPALQIRTWGAEWSAGLDEILTGYDVVVNGMDDVVASIRLYRAARRHRVTVIDAFVSPHPSVTRVAPDDPRPEEWLGFPSAGLTDRAVVDGAVTHEIVQGALLAELSYVAAVSRGIARFDARVVKEILRGERPRSSFAPVVVVSGNLMAFEAIGALLERPSAAGYRGYFLDPWTGRVERPGSPAALAVRRRIALRRLIRARGNGS